jgi:hypothetical protein
VAFNRCQRGRGHVQSMMIQGRHRNTPLHYNPSHIVHDLKLVLRICPMSLQTRFLIHQEKTLASRFDLFHIRNLCSRLLRKRIELSQELDEIYASKGLIQREMRLYNFSRTRQPLINDLDRFLTTFNLGPMYEP